MELQSGEMRLVFGRSQWPTAPDVHDAVERFALGSADHSGADQGVFADQRPGYGCVVEFPGEKADQAVSAAAARCAGWHVAHGASGHRSRAGISKVHRMLFVPGRVSRFARSPLSRSLYRAAFSGAFGGAGDASAGYGRPRARVEENLWHRVLQYYEV